MTDVAGNGSDARFVRRVPSMTKESTMPIAGETVLARTGSRDRGPLGGNAREAN